MAFTKLKRLLDAVDELGSSEWEFVADIDAITIEFTGMVTGDEVEIHTTNARAKPASATDGTPMPDAVVADGMRAVDRGARWLKLKVTDVSGGGDITADMNLSGRV